MSTAKDMVSNNPATLPEGVTQNPDGSYTIELDGNELTGSFNEDTGVWHVQGSYNNQPIDGDFEEISAQEGEAIDKADGEVFQLGDRWFVPISE